MDTREYETSFKLEGTYWWFIGQQYLVRQFLEKYFSGRGDLRLLDVGCGTGITLQILKQYGQAEGMDIADDAIYFCRKRGLSITKGDLLKMPFADNSFDVITCLGVFYHEAVKDDFIGFKEIFRVLNPNGKLLFLDCAMPSLYGKHDIAFHGIRRYTKKELKHKLESTGFAVEQITYYNFLLFLPVYLRRKLGKLSSSSPKSEVDEKINPIVNKILLFIYICELRLSKFFSYPVGINILAVGRK